MVERFLHSERDFQGPKYHDRGAAGENIIISHFKPIPLIVNRSTRVQCPFSICRVSDCYFQSGPRLYEYGREKKLS